MHRLFLATAFLVGAFGSPTLPPLHAAEPAGKPQQLRIVLIGDSTVASFTTPRPDRPDLTGWGQVFGEATIASAMIDRIVHHADVIALKGASYRIKHTAIESLPSVEADRQADSTP